MKFSKRWFNSKWILFLVLGPILAAGVFLGALYLSFPPFNDRRLILPTVYYPTWSPDGTKIAFISPGPGETWEIYSIGVDGSKLRRLTDIEENIQKFDWSPSGEKIAFTSYSANEYFNVYQMNSDGSDLFLLNGLVDDITVQILERLSYPTTRIPLVPRWETTGSLSESKFDETFTLEFPNNSDGMFPEKSGFIPDCINVASSEDRVAFTSRGEQSLFIFDIYADKLTKLDGVKPSYCQFALSPDGSKLAYISSVEVFSSHDAHMIYVVDVEEAGQAHCLTCRLRLFLNIRLGYYHF